jgi:hypothetical protein
MLRRLRPLVLSLIPLFAEGCLPGASPQFQTANTVIAGLACGVAAANQTPCTSTEVLTYLTKLQQREVESVVAKAENVEPRLVQALVEALAANTDSNKRIFEQLMTLVLRAQPTATPAPSAPAPTPSPAPALP